MDNYTEDDCSCNVEAIALARVLLKKRGELSTNSIDSLAAFLEDYEHLWSRYMNAFTGLEWVALVHDLYDGWLDSDSYDDTEPDYFPWDLDLATN